MKFLKSEWARADRIDGDIVLINTITMKCFLLNDMAATLWDAIDHYPDLDDLLGLLRDADVADPAGTLETLANQLVETGLLGYAPA